MIKEFYLKGHHYKLVPIEGSSDYMFIKDGTKTVRVSKEIAERGQENASIIFDK